jgi:hypothetical protein
MWTTLAVVAALGGFSAADDDSLSLNNIRLTYGVHGPGRASSTLLPGDSLCIAFDIQGISADANGKVLYSTALEFADRSGKVIFKQDPQPLEAVNSLGGNQVPAFAHIDIGLEQPPGDYTVNVTVTDRLKKKPQSFSRGFRVLPKDFGLVRTTTTGDNEGKIPVAVPGVGEALFINFGIVGFERDRATKQPHVAVEMEIFDESGRATTAKPFAGVIKEKVPENAPSLPGQFLISLNRAGKFRVELKATCQLTKKTSTVTLPLTVSSPQK